MQSDILTIIIKQQDSFIPSVCVCTYTQIQQPLITKDTKNRHFSMHAIKTETHGTVLIIHFIGSRQK